MDYPVLLYSWLVEAISGLPAALLDPENRAPILAIVVLAILYPIASSVNRLKRKVDAAAAELSAIRTTLRRIELSLDRLEETRLYGEKEERAIRDLLFKVDNDRPQRQR